MKVVADTSVLNYLILIGTIELLPYLFKKINIPHAVFKELTHEQTPNVVREFIKTNPNWLEIHKIEKSYDEKLSMLHKGEREAIILAKKINADLILLDDWESRVAAKSCGLKVSGLLKILELGDIRQQINLPQTLKKLSQTI